MDEQQETNQISTKTKPYDLEPNMEAALAYLISPITGIMIYALEKENEFVRFHAMQSILFGIVSFVFFTISNALIVLFIGILLVPIISTAIFLVWLLLMWKAFNNEEFELPYLGKIAHDQVSKS